MSHFDLLFSNLKVIELYRNNCFLCDASFDSNLVATKCGHLFCAACLNESINDQNSKTPPIQLVCPACDTAIEKVGPSRQRLKFKIKRLSKLSQMERSKLLKVLKMCKALRSKQVRSKPMETIVISSDSEGKQVECTCTQH